MEADVSARWVMGGCSAHTLHRRHPHSLVGHTLGCGSRSGRALVERHLPEKMGLSKAWRFVRGVSLVAAVLVWLGALLCLLPTELDVSEAFRPADSPPLDRGAQEGYLAVLQEEGWEADKVTVNADLLRMVVLALWSLLGLRFGWLLSNYKGQQALCSLGLVGGWLASGGKELPFLGVLRL
jgi:hypothetical protein